MPLVDARTLPDGHRIEAELILIGGGLAGLAIAREWAGSTARVAVIESGGLDAEPETQELSKGAGVVRAPGNPDKPIDDYLAASRHRGLGGSGRIWGGKCAPLDEADFARRSWIAGSGWPMSRQGLQPFYDRACTLLGLPRFTGAPPGEPGRPALDFRGSAEFFSAPRAFSRFSGIVDAKAFDGYRRAPAEAANITVYLHANVTAIRRDRSSGEVTGLDLARLDGKRGTARASLYVLATGGVENARLMLTSRIGGDLVGRFFQGHTVYGRYGAADGASSAILLSGAERAGLLYDGAARDKIHCVITAAPAGQRRRRSGNFTATLVAGQSPANATTVKVDPGGGLEGMIGLAAALDERTGGAPPGVRAFNCYLMSEHLPNPQSRVTLDDKTDALGMPRIRLEWVYSAADIRSLEAQADALAAALGAAGLGRMGWPIEPSALLAAWQPSRHHMGTTRMHRDPALGVVDPDGRVHGAPNLYVAGSSVFPTSGLANPTLTLMALAMRLSDHLKRRARTAA